MKKKKKEKIKFWEKNKIIFAGNLQFDAQESYVPHSVNEQIRRGRYRAEIGQQGQG